MVSSVIGDVPYMIADIVVLAVALKELVHGDSLSGKFLLLYGFSE